jgi:hypothetical protein
VRSRSFLIVAAAAAVAVLAGPRAFARGGGRGGGGGGGGSRGGGFSQPSGGRVPSNPPNRSWGDNRPLAGDGSAQLPSGNRPSQAPRPRVNVWPASRPSNFLGAASGVGQGVALGAAVANRAAPDPRPARPEQRPNWAARSQNRDYQWRQRVDTRNQAWNQRVDQRQMRREQFQQNRDQRWADLESRREDRQNWRDQRREDWQQRRNELWDYRADRGEEIWDKVRDFYDDLFDDAWWGRWSWVPGWPGYYPVDPWWWWASPEWSSVAPYESIPPEPEYVDYGMNVIYEDEVVYVDGQPIPIEEYYKTKLEAAANVEQPPPPLPPSDPPQASEWMPLGVFALCSEASGDPAMFFQLSINRDGIISGAYKNTISDDNRSIAGRVDKASQGAVWRIGNKATTLFETSLGNLTQSVSPIAIHFDNKRSQVWLLVRLPAPAPAGQPQKLPESPKNPPPLKTNPR